MTINDVKFKNISKFKAFMCSILIAMPSSSDNLHRFKYKRIYTRTIASHKVDGWWLFLWQFKDYEPEEL